MFKTLILLSFLSLCECAVGQFKQNDTLFFVRRKTGSFYHRVFIDTNKQSEFYSRVSDFSIAGFDTDTYKRTRDYLHSKKLFQKKRILNKVPREWVALEIYKGKSYVYSPADYYFHYKVKLTDSLFIDWTGEGPEATYIQEFDEYNPRTYRFILKSESYSWRQLTVKYIDEKKGIAIFQNKYYRPSSTRLETSYQLMVDVKKIRDIPIIVNTCDNSKQDELQFDTVDYAKMFMRIK
jgi:hypothetical protein